MRTGGEEGAGGTSGRRRGGAPVRVAAGLLAVVLSLAVTAVPVAARTAPVAARTGRVASAALPGIGVQFHATWSDYTDAQRTVMLDRLAAAHAGWVRVDLGWDSFQPSAPGGLSGWYTDLVDSVVAQARARGISVLATLWRTPGWANGGGSTAKPPANPQNYAAVASLVATHFRGRIAAWEMWNEPNQTAFWTGTPAAYAALAQRAYPAFKSADPAALVVLGGTAYNDTGYLSQLYGAGVAGSFDVLATHPYMGVADAPPETPDDGTIWTMDHVGAVHRLMATNGDGAKPIWFTEFGWSTHTNPPSVPNWQRGVTPAQQADYLVRAYRFMAAHHPEVTVAFWYEERDSTTGVSQVDDYGLFTHDLQAKPSYSALASLTPLPPPPPPAPGYTLVDRSGTMTPFGGDPPQPGTPLSSTVAAAGSPGGAGAWEVDDGGALSALGTAPDLGSLAGLALNQPIVGMAATATGQGYWMVAKDGGIFTFGDAAFHGSTGGLPLNQPIVGMAATPTGQGYWLVARDGGIFTFGDAPFFGSTGGLPLNQPIVGMAATATGQGYWLVARDGGIFTFGDAAFHGSTGGLTLNQPIVGMGVAVGGGYWLVARDGGIFTFGDAPFLGSLGGTAGTDVVGMITGPQA